jgi:hypothetical protein
MAGWNRPGCLPEAPPIECGTWSEARGVLRAELGEHFMHLLDLGDPPDNEAEAMGEYTSASAILRDVKAEHPFSLVYDQFVWWVADLPVQ